MARLKRIAKWAALPAFYLLLLVLFIRLTFPYEAIGNRLVSEFNAQQPSLGEATKRLEIGEVSGYWFFGIEVENLRYISEAPTTDKEAKPSVLEVEHAFASISPLRALFGTIHVDFGAEVDAGEISGTYSSNDELAELALELADVDVSRVAPLRDLVELPITGTLSGEVDLSMPERQLKLANGSVDLTIEGLTLGDGKAKIRETIALPKMQAGSLRLEAKSSEGSLEIKEFSAKGKDFELVSQGGLRLRDPFEQSLADVDLRFKFTDAYRNKNDLTRGIFGAPGSKVPALFELDPQIKRSKGADGFYGWKLSGPIGRLNFRPSPRGGVDNNRRGSGHANRSPKR